MLRTFFKSNVKSGVQAINRVHSPRHKFASLATVQQPSSPSSFISKLSSKVPEYDIKPSAFALNNEWPKIDAIRPPQNGSEASSSSPHLVSQQSTPEPVSASTFVQLPDIGTRESGPNMFLPPDRLSDVEALKARYVMGRKIGDGKFGTVFEAVDTVTDEKVAIKVLNKERSGPLQCNHELQMMEHIKEVVGHDRLTPIKNVYEDAENMYFVIELLRGGELYDVIETNGHLAEDEVAVVIRKLAFALDALHRHGIIHRDIKLENIVLTDDDDDNDSVVSDGEGEPNEFKITDFGFSREVSAEDSFDTPAGTLGYVAPEVLKHRKYGPACDVWSAGVVMYMLLTGHAPFPLHPDADKAKTMQERLEYELEAIEYGRAPEVWHPHLAEEPMDAISKDAKDLLTKMLKEDPNKRITIQGVLNHPFIKRHQNGTWNEYLNFE